MRQRLDSLMKVLKEEEKRYVKILKRHYKARKRERDTFFTSQDRNVLIEPFFIGGLLEKFAERLIARIV